MCTYLAINTSSIQLIPATAIAVLAANNASNPTAIVGTSIMATTCAAIAAVTAAKFLQRLPIYRLPPVMSPVPQPVLATAEPQAAKAAIDKPIIKEAATLQPLEWWGVAIMATFGAFFLYLFFRLAFPEAMRQTLGNILPALAPHAAAEDAASTTFVRIVGAVSKISIPFMLSAFPLYAALRHVKVYEEFVDGAKEGFDVAIRILPYLVAILVAIGMFRAAGGIKLLSDALAPAMRAVGFPSELLPMVLMRPLSGSGTLGVFAELVKQCGPDSLISRMGGTIFGSTETTFYVLAVYFGSVSIKRTRYALLAGLIADTVGVIASVVVCKLVFG
jgi:spore maturation protein SpmB